MAVRSCAVQVTRFAACRSTGPSLRNKAASNRQIRSSHISPRPPASINFHRAPIQVARPRVSSSPRPAYQARGTVTTMSASSVAEFIGTQTPIFMRFLNMFLYRRNMQDTMQWVISESRHSRFAILPKGATAEP